MMLASPNSLIQIVPSLPPAIDGIGDYALQLARRLRTDCGVETSFVVCDRRWQQTQWTNEFPAYGLTDRSRQDLGAAIASLTKPAKPRVPILLQFSPYGYEKRGCPAWLVSSLESIVEAEPGRLHIAFHELEVQTARVWSSAFWVPGLQRSLIRRLLKISDFTYTNTDLHRMKLEAQGGKKVLLIPNFSNIGETGGPPPIIDRNREVVIFGRADQRRWTYEHGAEALTLVCKHIGATRIVDIGAPIPKHIVSTVGGTPILRRGVLPADEVALAMRKALGSFMYYPVPLLTKSGVHALSCASGTVSFICPKKNTPSTCRGLVAGLDYIVVDDSQSLPPVPILDRLAPAIYASYGERTSAIAACVIAGHIYGSHANVSLLREKNEAPASTFGPPPVTVTTQMHPQIGCEVGL